jgi:hypothetical protein
LSHRLKPINPKTKTFTNPSPKNTSRQN